MEVLVRDEDKNKYESFAFSGYYHTFRSGEEDTGKKNCLIQDFWSDDCEELPKLLVKSLDQHDSEVRADERKKVVEELSNWHYKKLLEVRQKEIVENQDKGSEDEMARLYALFLGRYNILGDLQQKLTELKGE